ncbi:MAG: transcription antitermination factor NusB [Cyclobacteriaceae bacterium]
MLNRRILRVKAMQALYGYFTSVESLKEVARAELTQIHALDPAKHDFSDKALFEARKKLAVKLFNANHLKSAITFEDEVEEEVAKNVESEIEDFQKKISFEAKNRKAEMLKDARKIFHSYLRFLQLPIELEHREKLDNEKRKKKITPFIDNKIIEALKSSETLTEELKKHSISWGDEVDEIKDWYRREICTSEHLDDFFDGKIESDSFVQELFKKVIFKNEHITSFLENKNLHWSENQPIVKSMLLKTLKGLQDGSELVLSDLTKNGKEDFDFFEQIYDGVLKENAELDALIESKTKNWDVERIALTDLVILKISLVEMMTCPSIPMKVSINEAIEISKQYSTPKSKQFINGVLDVLSNELTSTGKVRKSGRGLIDNK